MISMEEGRIQLQRSGLRCPDSSLRGSGPAPIGRVTESGYLIREEGCWTCRLR